MNFRKLQVLVVFVTMSMCCGFAQKVKTGYDKTADFSKYKTYTLKLPPTPSSRPLLYASVVGSIRNGIESKGLTSVDKDGDITVIAAGDLDYGLNSEIDPLADTCANCQSPQVDVLYWAGFKAPEGSAGKPQPKGVLRLDFVDRATNKEIWVGTVTQKLEPTKADKSLVKVGEAIQKLLAEYPPKK